MWGPGEPAREVIDCARDLKVDLRLEHGTSARKCSDRPVTVFSVPRSYGRVYATADPYHHTIGPAATYSVGTMVSP